MGKWTLLLTLLFAVAGGSGNEKRSLNSRWMNYYRHITNTLTKDLSPFSRKAGKFLPEKTDLVFVLDASKRKPKQCTYEKSLKLVSRLLDYFSVSPGTARVGLITYGNRRSTEFGLNEYYNREGTQHIFKLLQDYNSTTATNSTYALGRARIMFSGFTRPGTQRLLVFITTGFQNQAEATEALAAAKELEKLNVTRMSLSVGHNKFMYQTRLFASQKKNVAYKQYYHYFIYGSASLKWITKLLRFVRSPFLHCEPDPIKSKLEMKQYFRDELNRRCECSEQRLVKCTRVRQEIMSMSKHDRETFIRAYHYMTMDPVYRPVWLTLVQKHTFLFGLGIHNKDEFLPWHRWFLWELENKLKLVDGRLTLPYWDWSIIAHDSWNHTHGLFGDRHDGIGRRSNPMMRFCVTTGIFRMNNWQDENNICLRRWLFGNPPDAAQVELVKRAAEFSDFELRLRVNLHDTVHCLIGGTMCTRMSASAPEFFFHHNFIDQIWWEGQQRTEFFSGNKTFSKRNLRLSPYTYEQFLDINDLPKNTSYIFSEPGADTNGSIVKSYLKQLTPFKLVTLPRIPFETINYEAMDLFRLKKLEVLKAEEFEEKSTMYIRRRVEKNIVEEKKPLENKLTGYARRLGFSIPSVYVRQVKQKLVAKKKMLAGVEKVKVLLKEKKIDKKTLENKVELTKLVATLSDEPENDVSDDVYSDVSDEVTENADVFLDDEAATVEELSKPGEKKWNDAEWMPHREDVFSEGYHHSADDMVDVVATNKHINDEVTVEHMQQLMEEDLVEDEEKDDIKEGEIPEHLFQEDQFEEDQYEESDDTAAENSSFDENEEENTNDDERYMESQDYDNIDQNER